LTRNFGNQPQELGFFSAKSACWRHGREAPAEQQVSVAQRRLGKSFKHRLRFCRQILNPVTNPSAADAGIAAACDASFPNWEGAAGHVLAAATEATEAVSAITAGAGLGAPRHGISRQQPREHPMTNAVATNAVAEPLAPSSPRLRLGR
jgi:hypothetical protein